MIQLGLVITSYSIHYTKLYERFAPWTSSNSCGRVTPNCSLSFVRSADDVITLKEILNRTQSPLRVIAKIEKPEAVDNFEAILAVTDGVMVRITSYNVCYTKLLRDAKCLIRLFVLQVHSLF